MAESGVLSDLRSQIKALAGARGWTDGEVASRVGISRRQYYRWLAGDAQITDLEKLAGVVGARLRVTVAADDHADEPAWVEGAIQRAVGSVRVALLDPEITDEEAEHMARLFARVYMAALDRGLLRLPPDVGAPRGRSGGGGAGAS